MCHIVRLTCIDFVKFAIITRLNKPSELLNKMNKVEAAFRFIAKVTITMTLTDELHQWLDALHEFIWLVYCNNEGIQRYRTSKPVVFLNFLRG